ncbi:alcohol dehydrogenase catalytic domain-containing protein [Asaia bogorensis]|uniref:alcohol dehydrogenase catalytic domain-containing protein n=1 Tax=Asaia bogorensis TaxID=91915 RepID=UPI0013C4EA0B|nr:alcohol dehydrogenase catalytic domain-containing protein [Asaia bogorensis]
MRALVFDGQGGMSLQSRAEPSLGDDSVLIAPSRVGICGTDLHLLTGDYPLGRFPRIAGHEFAGRVVAVGATVSLFAPGDRVCVDPNISCGQCAMCRAGAPNLCSHLVPVGVTIDGAFAERVAVPEKIVHRLPAHLDMASGALIEPLACVVHALERAPDLRGGSVLIYGAGSIGLMAIALARHHGAAHVEVIEPSATRRDAALDLGADGVFAPGERRIARDIGFVIEASGPPLAVADALKQLAPRGVLIQMGVCSPEATIALHPFDLFDRELTIIGSQSLSGAYERAIGITAALPDLAKKIVSHVYDLAEAPEAFAMARSETARKVQIRCDAAGI